MVDKRSYPIDAAHEEIDGGRDCNLPPGTPHLWLGEGINCCNGEVCRGRCLLFDGWERPVCACSRLIGGCSAPRVCCNHRCATEVTCGQL